MEESLLKFSNDPEDQRISSSNSSSTHHLTRACFFEEVKRQCYIAGPMVAVILSQNLLRIVSMMMVGHLGELALSSSSLAISLTGVTGFSLFMGMAGGLETICGQAFGAKQYQKIGFQTYTAIVSINLVGLPLTLIWIYMEDLLILIGQDPSISREAGKFTIWLIPALFAYGTLQALMRYFQTQSLTLPMFLSSCVTLLIHIPLCWGLVFKSGLDNLGGALAVSISYWLNVVLLTFYMKFSSACSRTKVPISKEVFYGMKEFFSSAIPSALMICLEWWSSEILILLSGHLQNPTLETSVLSVCVTRSITLRWLALGNVIIPCICYSLQISATLYSIPYAFGAAASTRVSNELGAGNPEGACMATRAAMFLALSETTIVTTTLFACRNVYGYTFSNDRDVIDYITTMAPLVCLSVLLDSFQAVLSGIARGCGWQQIGAYINLAAFYICGIPVAAILAFWLQLRGRGLWIGLQVGIFAQTTLLAIVTTRTNWENLAIKARERILRCGRVYDSPPRLQVKRSLPDSTDMENSFSLFPNDTEDQRKSSSDSSSTHHLTWVCFFEEVKRQCYVAGPMVAVILSQNLLRIVSMMMVGHLGKLALSSSSLALSLTGVTGFSLFMGMASGLETICGQAYGAKQYQKLGRYTYTAIFSINLVGIPLSLIWIYMEDLLIFIGQDPSISHEAGKFTIWLIPGLFAYATLQALIRYFQAQSLIIPMLVSSCATLLFHIPLCWVLVFKSGLGNVGGALAISISYWLNVIILVFYIKFSNACSKTRVPISKEVFYGIKEFFSFAIPSAVMICLEWWSFEMLILLSGLLPNPALETSVLSVCLQTLVTIYYIVYGFAAAASIRVSNELGAGNPEGARIATCAAMFLAITETALVTTTLFACRNAFGYVFSNEKEVVEYVTNMAPLVCLSVILDSLQSVLSGIARGCGWQQIGAYINLGAFYVFGIPIAALLAFWVQLGGRGLWIGIQVGAFVQTILLAFVTTCTNWDKQASKARERISERSSLEANGLLQ